MSEHDTMVWRSRYEHAQDEISKLRGCLRRQDNNVKMLLANSESLQSDNERMRAIIRLCPECKKGPPPSSPQPPADAP